MDKEVVLSLRNITVKHLQQLIFKNLTLQLKQGEHLAIVGASGSGKSALLETIKDTFHISNGEMTFPALEKIVKIRKEKDPYYSCQRLITQVASRHQFKNLSNIAEFYFQQRFNASDSEDVETVEQYLVNLEKTAGEGFWTFERVVSQFNLLPLKNKHLIKLSNGETKRLLIAAALIKNPMILLLDNPLAGLDVATRKDFNDVLKEIADTGISIIMTTSPTEIPETITHVAILEKGTLKDVIARENFNLKLFQPDMKRVMDKKLILELLGVGENEKFRRVVEMKNVTIQYGEKTILNNINWKINQGERWALLGPNGAGKSTLLSLINGDNPQAYANDIVLFDVKRGSGESIWDIKKKTGFVSPELFQYFPSESSCLHVVESGFSDSFGLFKKSDPVNAEQAKRWLQLFHLGEYAAKSFKHVSASTQRLCLLARALVKNPVLLILDEPFQGLDPQQQQPSPIAVAASIMDCMFSFS
ncbi:MAG TPA: ATP-binding cassette domain-containing protein [Bacteroidia bacterium]|nr:ATP-binding cassette domain-containing protein [Bacteroidia bacterium]HRG53489.1 ATP-binding cassette domain-containing protein [Bacteroidia bacterium]